MAVRQDLHLNLTEIAQLNLRSRKQEFFEQGDKNGRFLAMLAQHEHPLTIIPELHTSAGNIISTQEAILVEFTQFYNALYFSSLKSDFCPLSLAPFLDPLALGWLSNLEHTPLA